MILYMICQLVCVTDSWAHMSLVHSILSLKLGVIARRQCTGLGDYRGARAPGRGAHRGGNLLQLLP